MLAFRARLLNQLLEEKFKRSPSELLRRWPGDTPPNRTTLWRWLNGNPPSSRDHVLALAAAFDLDPFSLFETSDRGFSRLCHRITIAARIGGLKRFQQQLPWLDGFVGPLEDWPPRELAETFFGRPWKVVDRSHHADLERNYYACLNITARPREFGAPQVWHFAFRSLRAAYPVWLPYGFVERRKDEVALYEFDGHTDRASVTQGGAAQITVETWFGEDRVDFRVASLHDFELSVTRRSDGSRARVRFS